MQVGSADWARLGRAVLSARQLHTDPPGRTATPHLPPPQAPKACSIVLRGASKDVLNEVERNLHDAMGVARNVCIGAPHWGCWWPPGGGWGWCVSMEALPREQHSGRRAPHHMPHMCACPHPAWLLARPAQTRGWSPVVARWRWRCRTGWRHGRTRARWRAWSRRAGRRRGRELHAHLP